MYTFPSIDSVFIIIPCSKELIPLYAIPKGSTATPANMPPQQLYEEISDVATPHSTGNIVPPRSSPETAVADAMRHQYEDVEAAGLHGEGGSYHITLCSAYGVPLDHGKQS